MPTLFTASIEQIIAIHLHFSTEEEDSFVDVERDPAAQFAEVCAFFFSL